MLCMEINASGFANGYLNLDKVRNTSIIGAQ